MYHIYSTCVQHDIHVCMYVVYSCPWYKIDILLSRVTQRPGHAHLHQAQFWNFLVQVKWMANFLHVHVHEIIKEKKIGLLAFILFSLVE
jgi:hypothetical protein